MKLKYSILKLASVYLLMFLCSISYGQSKKDSSTVTKGKKVESTINRSQRAKTATTQNKEAEPTKNGDTKEEKSVPAIPGRNDNSRVEQSSTNTNSRFKSSRQTTNEQVVKEKESGDSKFGRNNNSRINQSSANTNSRFKSSRQTTKGKGSKEEKTEENKFDRFNNSRINQSPTNTNSRFKNDRQSTRSNTSNNPKVEGRENYAYQRNSQLKLNSDVNRHFRNMKFGGTNYLRNSNTSYRASKGEGRVYNKKGSNVEYKYFLLTDEKGDIGGFYLGTENVASSFNVQLTKGEANDRLANCKYDSGPLGGGDQAQYDRCINRLVIDILTDCLLSSSPADCAANCWYNGGNCVD